MILGPEGPALGHLYRKEVVSVHSQIRPHGALGYLADQRPTSEGYGNRFLSADAPKCTSGKSHLIQIKDGAAKLLLSKKT